MGGLACLVKQSLSLTLVLYPLADNFLAIRISNLVLVNVYLPYNQNLMSSLTILATVCSSISSLTKNIESHGYNWLLMGNFNCDKSNNSNHAGLISESLTAGFCIVPKGSRDTYTHNSETLHNTDHCACSATVTSSDIHVDKDEHDYNHSPSILKHLHLFFCNPGCP